MAMEPARDGGGGGAKANKWTIARAALSAKQQGLKFKAPKRMSIGSAAGGPSASKLKRVHPADAGGGDSGKGRKYLPDDANGGDGADDDTMVQPLSSPRQARPEP